MTLRKHVCFGAENKISTCIKIIEKYPKKKWIIFSKSKKFVDKLHEKLTEQGIKSVSYHSGMSTKQRTAALATARSDDCRVICSATALNAGYNLPSIDAAIIAAGTSTELTNIQQIGRTVRLQENKRALVVNLYADKTQEKKWVENKLKNTSSTWITSLKELKDD